MDQRDNEATAIVTDRVSGNHHVDKQLQLAQPTREQEDYLLKIGRPISEADLTTVVGGGKRPSRALGT